MGRQPEGPLDGWAVEGEKVVLSVKDRKVVDDITAKVDLDQAKEQVSKLRDQLEELLATWRTSFRPEKTEVKETKEAPAKEAPAKEAPAKEAPGPQEWDEDISGKEARRQNHHNQDHHSQDLDRQDHQAEPGERHPDRHG